MTHKTVMNDKHNIFNISMLLIYLAPEPVD